MLAVVTPQRIAAFRAGDGDLRWVLPAARGCAFDPGRYVRTAGILLVAQPCPGHTNWTAELMAVDDLGRIVPGRTPLRNDLPHDPPNDPRAVSRRISRTMSRGTGQRKQLRDPVRLARMAFLLVH